MLAALRRLIVAAITPPPPVREQAVTVRAHVRKRPVNAKREALHDQLRRELGR